MLAKMEKAKGKRTDLTSHNGCAKLPIQAKLGELLPAKTREESGAMKGGGGAVGALPFAKRTIANYRKVAKSAGELAAYQEKVEASNATLVAM